MSCDVCRGHSLSGECPCCGESQERCPDCNGTGKRYQIFDVIDRELLFCDKDFYWSVAEDEDDAEERGERYCRVMMMCKTCGGTGYAL